MIDYFWHDIIIAMNETEQEKRLNRLKNKGRNKLKELKSPVLLTGRQKYKGRKR
jgi:hypothetical protein